MEVTDFRGRYFQVTNLKDLGAENLETINKISLEQRGMAFKKTSKLHRPLELLASQERNESDGSTGAIITLRLFLEYAMHERRPFVMIESQ